MLAASRSARQLAAASNVISVRVPIFISRGVRLLFLHLVEHALAKLRGLQNSGIDNASEVGLRLAGIGAAQLLTTDFPTGHPVLHVRSCGCSLTGQSKNRFNQALRNMCLGGG